MNLTRIGNWAADDFAGKQKRIQQFLMQTDGYLSTISVTQLPPKLSSTMTRFINEYCQCNTVTSIVNPSDWADIMLTWGIILTHRAKLLTS